MPEILVEICCGSADDVIQAKLGGADRIELNSGMPMGGLTPSIGTLTLARQVDLPIMTMVRPRESGFCYTDKEFETMLLDTAKLVDAGADGIVFGILNKDGTIDTRRCTEMMKIIGDKQSVFHRAFDFVPDWQTAIDELIKMKVTRILTSGQEQSALKGASTLKKMIEYAAGHIEICIGGGIRCNNVSEILGKTGATQIHAYITKEIVDSSTTRKESINLGPASSQEDVYKLVDAESVKDIITAARKGV